ncbi:hypothetical protein Tco_1497795 [Tanacetum coccineum]
MSNSEYSTVTYTEVSNPYADLSDIGSPGVDGPPVMLKDPYAYVVAAFQAPPSPDYVPGLEEPEQAPPPPVYVPYVLEPVYPEFMPPEDEVPLAEEQPLPATLSSTADLLGYVPESDPEEDPKEDDDFDIEGDEEEEEHPDPADSTAVALPAVDHALSAEETEPISIQDDPPTPVWSDTEVARLLAIPTLPPLPLSPWSSPLPQIPSPPLPVSPPPPASPTYPLGYRAAIIRLRAEAPSTSHSPPPHIILSHTRADTPPSGTPPLLLIPLPTSSSSLLLPFADHGADRPEVCLPPRKRLCFAFGPRYEVGESSSTTAARPTGGFRADYGFVATMDKEIMHDLKRDFDYKIINTWDEMMVMSLRTTVLGQQAVITELQAADCRRQAVITELLAVDRRRQAQFIEALTLLKRL